MANPSSSPSSASSILSYSTRSSSESTPHASVAQSRPGRIPATQIVAFLDLLDAFDADVEAQLARAKENISEVRELVKVVKAEWAEKLVEARRKKERIERGTVAVDSEFWCTV
ncbi:hypothetical protein GYMLUDRAFT_37123 [Collybiopsis luxurians FD-317 M1]|nr:hypothetical protein GYMLUDRAFT_37123 [Collybiopsis luxurians FD-317 M1]